MDKKIKVRLRLVIIKNNKLLVTYNSTENFYFYVGGKLEFGETLKDGCQREIQEECGEGTLFNLEKILYIRDYIKPEEFEHSVEFYILGTINKFEELEKKIDPEDEGRHWLTWLDIESLPNNLYPKTLSSRLDKDFKSGFPNPGEYLGQIE